MSWLWSYTEFLATGIKRVKQHRHRSRINSLKKAGLQMGDNCRIAWNVSFGTSPFLIKIGDHVDISSRVNLITHDGADDWFSDEDSSHKYRERIEIRDNCFLGVGAIILPGVVLGPRSIVGAGSVVTRDVRPNTVVSGNPAREVCSVDLYLQMKKNRVIPLDSTGARSESERRQRLVANIEKVQKKRRNAQVGG